VKAIQERGKDKENESRGSTNSTELQRIAKDIKRKDDGNCALSDK